MHESYKTQYYLHETELLKTNEDFIEARYFQYSSNEVNMVNI
jgi:hypothetical protein